MTKKERLRLKANQIRESEEARVRENWERIKNMKSGFESNKKISISNMPDYSYRRGPLIPSNKDGGCNTGRPVDNINSLPEEMQVRELIARKEIEEKKKCVAITVNKGTYQYITPGMDPSTFGKK